VIQRDEARILVNMGDREHDFALLEGEDLKLISVEGTGVAEGRLKLPPMSLAVLMSTTEQAEDREVH
jgi:maltooligosyltrehalose trehalohydrolase